MLTLHSLKLLANLVNPCFALALLAAIWLPRRDGSGPPPGVFTIRAVVAVLLVFVVAHVNRWLHLWPAHPMFPSGHMAFAASIATSWFVLARRSLLWTVPLQIAYGALIVYLGYHVWSDIIGAWIVAPPLTWVCYRGVHQEINRGGAENAEKRIQ